MFLRKWVVVPSLCLGLALAGSTSAFAGTDNSKAPSKHAHAKSGKSGKGKSAKKAMTMSKPTEAPKHKNTHVAGKSSEHPASSSHKKHSKKKHA